MCCEALTITPILQKTKPHWASEVDGGAASQITPGSPDAKASPSTAVPPRPLTPLWPTFSKRVHPLWYQLGHLTKYHTNCGLNKTEVYFSSTWRSRAGRAAPHFHLHLGSFSLDALPSLKHSSYHMSQNAWSHFDLHVSFPFKTVA